MTFVTRIQTHTSSGVMLGVLLLASIVAATFAATVVTHAAPDVPTSCNPLIGKYLDSGLPDGSRTSFSLATHATRIGTSVGPIGAVPFGGLPHSLSSVW